MNKFGKLSYLEAKKTIKVLSIDNLLEFVEYDDIYFYWAYYQLEKKSFLNLLRKWKKNPPPKKVLKDFKKIINFHTYGCGKESNLLFDIYSINEEEDNYNDKEILELLELLLYFGLHPLHVIDNKTFFLYVKDSNKDLCQLLKKALAARVIVRAIKKALDDEFEMKPLRTRIDMNKISRLFEEEKIK